MSDDPIKDAIDDINRKDASRPAVEHKAQGRQHQLDSLRGTAEAMQDAVTAIEKVTVQIEAAAESSSRLARSANCLTGALVGLALIQVIVLIADLMAGGK